ncbi:Ribonuclease P/MRP, p29 subunit [Cordyceps fumosorosea ARSEF 2679]|uniref:Ribonuclease P protein subunit n=1 Tax=Cordyceps fumosorosea (strain ARSEF 2679) TaxID=1081104 RepID=A0A167MX61_CORFA|nr:Ribonuclease P/MRP, p29 subunit [Cordyceps fumosorosea ARSEF 2679]OAA54858.1 Ribonuclease P/MRP, p29 subunit [Cordyceps fumosorosea ARSEF 2679]
MATLQPLTQELLARAHPPETIERIFGEKIQHRKLRLRQSSPPPSALNARNARRKARQEKKEKERQKPKPLSSRQRRELGLHDVPATGQSYDIYAGLNKLWIGYARELLGRDIYTGGAGAAAKLASAELHGAAAQVVRSRCPGRVGIKGIIVRDRKFVIEIVTQKRGLKVVPKDGTTFRIEVPAPPEDAPAADAEQGARGAAQIFAFEVHGDQLMLRSADRANRKFKQHFLKDL